LAGAEAAAGIEESLRLCPIEDRRGVDSLLEGMIAGFSLGNHLLVVDYAGRLFREGSPRPASSQKQASAFSWGA
jgi:hypothetical protein